MSHFSYTRAGGLAGGLWAAGIPVLHTEFADFDEKTTKAINGDGGGTWAPSAPIVIGGQGVVIQTSASLTGLTVSGGGFASFSQAITLFQGTTVSFAGTTLNIAPNTTVWSAGTVTVASDSLWTFNSPPVFAAGFTVAGGTANILGTLGVFGSATIAGNLSVGGTFSANGNAHLLSNLAVDGASTFTGAATFGTGFTSTGIAIFHGLLSCQAPLFLTGIGHVVKRATVGVDADATYGPQTWDEVYAPPLTGARIWTIDDINAESGSGITFINDDSVHTINVVGTGFGGISLKNVSGGVRSVTMRFLSGAWRVGPKESVP